jgi:magnesium transporter
MISCRLHRDGHLEEEEFDPSRASDFLAETGTLVWLDVDEPEETDLAMLGKEFGLHALSVEDMHHRDQRPKVEGFGSYFFVVLRPLQAADGTTELEESELHALVGKNFLVTVRYPPVFDLTGVIARWDRTPDLTREGPGFLLYVLLDEMVDDYLGLVDLFEDAADELEDDIFGVEDADESREAQERVFLLKRNVVQFRRRAMPMRRVLDFLQEEPSVVTPALSPYYRDVADHVIRTTELTDNIRDLLTSLLEVRVALAANRLNEVMKKLTSWAAIILIPTLIAGIYGMNFRDMPELRWSFGYPLALLAMALSSIGLYMVFKKKDWL